MLCPFFLPQEREREEKNHAILIDFKKNLQVSKNKRRGKQPQFVCGYQQLKTLYLITMEEGTIQKSSLIKQSLPVFYD